LIGLVGSLALIPIAGAGYFIYRRRAVRGNNANKTNLDVGVPPASIVAEPVTSAGCTPGFLPDVKDQCRSVQRAAHHETEDPPPLANAILVEPMNKKADP